MAQKGLAPILTILIVVGLLVGGYFLYGQTSDFRQTKDLNKTSCTLEAKTCPDGTSVGRSGPKCEFAACPSSKSDKTANWKTYTDSYYHFSLRYPADWFVYSSNDYSKTGSFLEISDIPYQQILPGGENPKTGKSVTSLQIYAVNFGLPKRSNPYDNGREDNPTLHDITINSYKGWRSWNIQGTDYVTLINPNSGYVYLNFDYDNAGNYIESPIFNQILSTFKFTD